MLAKKRYGHFVKAYNCKTNGELSKVSDDIRFKSAFEAAQNGSPFLLIDSSLEFFDSLPSLLPYL
jgi:hypothetical protein